MCMDSVCVFSVCFGKEQKSNKYRLRNPLSSYSCNAELKIQLIAANVEVLLGELIGDKIALDNKNLFHLVLLCSYFSLLWSQGFIGKTQVVDVPLVRRQVQLIPVIFRSFGSTVSFGSVITTGDDDDDLELERGVVRVWYKRSAWCGSSVQFWLKKKTVAHKKCT